MLTPGVVSVVWPKVYNTFRGQLNQSANGSPAANDTNAGFYVVNRTSNTNTNNYKNGALHHSQSNNTNGLVNLPVYICAANYSASQYYNMVDNIKFAGIGGVLTATDVANLYTLITGSLS